MWHHIPEEETPQIQASYKILVLYHIQTFIQALKKIQGMEDPRGKMKSSNKFKDYIPWTCYENIVTSNFVIFPYGRQTT